MRVLMTGATGLIGRPLAKKFDSVVALSRTPARARALLGSEPRVAHHGWNGTEALPSDLFAGVDAVVHLAGEPVAGRRWTEEQKERIRESRIAGTRAVVDAMRNLSGSRPKVLLSASAIGIYGSRGDLVLDESSPTGQGFLAEVCRSWESEALSLESAGFRVVCLRIGIVLAPDGGALARMATPFRLGLGGRLGSGDQWTSWVHVDDLIGLAQFALENESLRGPVNATAPNPVTNAEFTRALGQVLHRPAVFPVPPFALQLAFGEMAEVLLASQRVVPRAALESGYRFRFSTLRGALENLFGREGRPPFAEVHGGNAR